jgi:hypothetical protein
VGRLGQQQLRRHRGHDGELGAQAAQRPDVVPHFYWNYGRPGPTAPYGCDGGHNFGCWNFAFLDALPRIMSVLSPPVG